MVGFDRGKALDAIAKVSPAATVFEVSARTGEGVAAWLDWLRAKRDEKVRSLERVSTV